VCSSDLRNIAKINLSLTHTRNYAAAIVLLEKNI
jgi:phosphopantetheinyl transferase (holo-ACP synthase)